MENRWPLARRDLCTCAVHAVRELFPEKRHTYYVMSDEACVNAGYLGVQSTIGVISIQTLKKVRQGADHPAPLLRPCPGFRRHLHDRGTGDPVRPGLGFPSAVEIAWVAGTESFHFMPWRKQLVASCRIAWVYKVGAQATPRSVPLVDKWLHVYELVQRRAERRGDGRRRCEMGLCFSQPRMRQTGINWLQWGPGSCSLSDFLLSTYR